jgi:hypothetical protein
MAVGGGVEEGEISMSLRLLPPPPQKKSKENKHRVGSCFTLTYLVFWAAF